MSTDVYPHVGYVTKVYPRLSETFIVDEIRAVEQNGARVSIFSLRPPLDGRFHADLALVEAGVTYLPSVSGSSVLQAFRSQWRLQIPSDRQESALDFIGRLPEKERALALVQGLHLAEAVSEHHLTHLHAHFMTVAAHATYLAHLATGIPYTVTAHAKDIFRWSVDWEVFSEVARAAAAVVTVCDANREYIMERIPGGAARVERIYNGVFLEPSMSRTRQSALIVAVGRLVEKKGFHHLIDTCRLLRSRGVRFTCLIVGGGEEEAALASQIEALGLTDLVKLVGPLARHEVSELMETARVIAAPCIEGTDGNRDALPTVLLEALAHGLPIVSTKLGGVPEIVDDGVQGILCAPGDVEELAAALELLLTDDERWERFHRAGPLRARDCFDRRKTALELLAVWSKAARPRVSR